MLDEHDPKVVYGRLLEKVETLVDDLHAVKTDVAALGTKVTALNSMMGKGWGIVIGAVGVLGMFAAELLTGFKRMLGIGG